MTRWSVAAALLVVILYPHQATALERLCDPAHEDCRAPLIALIDNETVGIDVAFWFMEDTRYSSALYRAKSRGVRVRVLMDTRANVNYPGNIAALQMIKDAGIPMRQKVGGGILHWKMMLFAAQRTVEFSGANFSAEAFVPEAPYSNYVDEVIYFTDRPSLVNSFMTKYDDVWVAPTGYENYANVTSVQRAYPISPIDPELNFPPGGFRERSVAQYAAEPIRIDSLMYRITDRAHTDALIDVLKRGVPIRLITEQLQYRDPSRLWHAWNVDRLYLAGQQQRIGGEPGIHVRHRRHDGLSHEKLTVLNGLGMAILGSSNWTTPSTDTQLEHNLFTTDPSVFTWSRDHFERKWFNRGPSPETEPFVPMPPDAPQLMSPASGALNQPLSVTLVWNAGPWAHKYDVFIGTDPNNLNKVADDRELGPYQQSWTVPGLAAGTTYYWRIVGRTMANLWRSSPTCSFRTTGGGSGATPPQTCLSGPAPPPDPVAVPEPQDAGLPIRSPSATPGSTPAPRLPGQPSWRPRSSEGVDTGTVAIPRP